MLQALNTKALLLILAALALIGAAAFQIERHTHKQADLMQQQVDGTSASPTKSRR